MQALGSRRRRASAGASEGRVGVSRHVLAAAIFFPTVKGGQRSPPKHGPWNPLCPSPSLWGLHPTSHLSPRP